jgi:ubiquinone biosynthesis protein UbiJ
MQPLPAIINHLLSRQSWARDKLMAHAGKSVRIDAVPLLFTLLVSASGEVESIPDPGKTDVAFKLSLAQLPLMLADPERALKSVHLTGDAEFAQTLGTLMRELRWDAEEDLSRLIGDVPAYRAMQGARAFNAWGRDAAQRLAGNGAAFLVDEEPMLVRQRMTEQFADEVAAARDACARLEKRIARLTAR